MPRDADLIFLLVCSIAYLILLVILRLLRVRFDSSSPDHLLQTVISVSKDSNFKYICRELCKIKKNQSREFYQILSDRSRLKIVCDYWFRSGWIGMTPDQSTYGLALPCRWPTNLLWTASIHEMFHLVRHVQKHATFEEEAKISPLSRRWLRIVLREEFHVWRKTFRVDQIGATTIWTIYLSLLVIPPIATFLVFNVMR